MSFTLGEQLVGYDADCGTMLSALSLQGPGASARGEHKDLGSSCASFSVSLLRLRMLRLSISEGGAPLFLGM